MPKVKYLLRFIYRLAICSIFVFFSCKRVAKTQSEHMFTNDLVHETSPYLLQHAHNPVEWKAWSPELFDTAKKDNKLVLISIGYSSCHWCHVMEHETFEDEEVAKLMNENFISIKVDREERPDVDQVYQTAIQLLGQNGGWPLNVIALPSGKPLYLGTYLPKKQWSEVLSKINQMYTDDPDNAKTYADQLAAGIQETNFLEPSSDFEKLTKETLKTGVENWQQRWDLDLGGNIGQQKFMTSSNLMFLLDYALLNEDKTALKHVKNTLDKVANGGIYDHIGGGFFRYSTDAKWKVPHFEKMLYDNAQAISLYAKAYSVFKEPAYKTIVYETIGFLEREMKNTKGGYYATLDADSEGKEGKYYVWTADELSTILGDDMPLFSAYYNIESANVWEDDNYVLYKSGNETDFLKTHKLTTEVFDALKQKWKEKLLAAKSNRVRPNTDDKIITSWNALLIKGLADAYAVFGDASFLDSAVATYNFIEANSYDKEHLVHSYKPNSKRTEGFLEDYAFLTAGSLALYRATLNAKYIDFATRLTAIVERDFSDTDSGMFAFNKDQQLISKIIKTNDGDIPSPNSVMANNLLQLGHINYNLGFLNQSKTMLTTVLPLVTEYTDSYANWGSLFLKVAHPYYEVAVVGKEAERLVKELGKQYVPNTLIVGTTQASERPLFKDRYFEDATYIYVCQNQSCKLPVKTVAAALKQLENF